MAGGVIPTPGQRGTFRSLSVISSQWRVTKSLNESPRCSMRVACAGVLGDSGGTAVLISRSGSSRRQSSAAQVWAFGRRRAYSNGGRRTAELATIACPFLEVSVPRSYFRAVPTSMPDACPRMLSRFSRVSDLSASGHRDGRGTGRGSAFGPAREEARGRRAHYKCRMDECPCLIDFYGAACRDTSAMGKSASARGLQDARIMFRTSRQQFSVAGRNR